MRLNVCERLKDQWNWHNYFAIVPVYTIDGEIVLCETVERRLIRLFLPNDSRIPKAKYEYRVRTH